MIETLRIQNYKALRDVTLSLTPMHVLIGPNDSGKTSVLEAVSALCRSTDVPLSDAFAGVWDGRDLVWHHDGDGMVRFSATVSDKVGTFIYQLACRFESVGQQVAAIQETFRVGEDEVDMAGDRPKDQPAWEFPATAVCSAFSLPPQFQRRRLTLDALRVARRVSDAFYTVHYYRWNPRLLSLPVALQPTNGSRMEQSGFGLARCLDDILGNDRRAFGRLEDRLVGLFPGLESVILKSEPSFSDVPSFSASRVKQARNGVGKGLYFQFADGDVAAGEQGEGRPVPASQVSDGLLLVLAYLAVLYQPKPPRVLLIEEPENGIHPKRLADVLRILRDLIEGQSHTQVILTTHSPYVLDHFQPEEVSLCRKRKDGSVSVDRLSDSGTVQRLKDVFSLGEIWTSEGDAALADPPEDHGQDAGKATIAAGAE